MGQEMVSDAGPLLRVDVILGQLLRREVAVDARPDVMDDYALDVR